MKKKKKKERTTRDFVFVRRKNELERRERRERPRLLGRKTIEKERRRVGSSLLGEKTRKRTEGEWNQFCERKKQVFAQTKMVRTRHPIKKHQRVMIVLAKLINLHLDDQPLFGREVFRNQK
jgi:hypothetical protein